MVLFPGESVGEGGGGEGGGVVKLVLPAPNHGFGVGELVHHYIYLV